MLRNLPVFFLLALSASVHAGTKVTLGFPDSTDKIVFTSATWPKGDPTSSSNYKTIKADYTVESSTKTDRIFVIDPQLGKVASKAVGDIQNNTWNIAKEEFSTIYKVTVLVSTPKGPVAAASVDFEDSSGKRTELIDPSSNGAANFMFVKPGEVKVAVSYKAEGKSQDPVRQSFTVGGDKDSTLKIALPSGEAVPSKATEAENTPAGTTAPKADKPANDPNAATGSPFGNILSTLIGLAFVVGVAYFVWQFAKRNPDRVKDTLTKLGADVPKAYDPSQDAANAPIPNAPIAPQPMQQIILDQSSAPPLTSAPIAMPTAAVATIAPVVTGVPKLIATDGSAFELPEGETVVGREFGNGLVVPNDTVSRKHASLLKMGTSVELQDHGSTNGTWVNGMKVAGSQTLRPGDNVRFGSIEYRFEG